MGHDAAEEHPLTVENSSKPISSAHSCCLEVAETKAMDIRAYSYLNRPAFLVECAFYIVIINLFG